MQITTNNYTPDIISLPENKIIVPIIDNITDNITTNIQESITNKIPSQEEEYEPVSYDDFFSQKKSYEDSREVANHHLSQDTNNYLLNRTVIETNHLENITDTQNIQELLDVSVEQKERIFSEIRNTIFSNTQNQKDEEEYLTQVYKNQHSTNLFRNEVQSYVSANGLEAQTHMLLMLTQQTVSSDSTKQNYHDNY